MSRQSTRREVRVAAQRREQLSEPVEDDREAVFDRPQPRAGCQRLDAGPLHRGLEGEVEVPERLPGRQPRELERGAHAALLARRMLIVEQPVEEAVVGKLALGGFRETRGQALGGVGECQTLKPRDGGIELDLGPGLGAAGGRALIEPPPQAPRTDRAGGARVPAPRLRPAAHPCARGVRAGARARCALVMRGVVWLVTTACTMRRTQHCQAFPRIPSVHFAAVLVWCAHHGRNRQPKSDGLLAAQTVSAIL